jgi:predicted transposase/invertase (TIGR01784 family)
LDGSPLRFKKLFGEEANKDLLIDFLNQLLPNPHQIAKLDFRNTENMPDLPADRKAIFDIYCTAISGERFIVEMQKAKMHYFKDRSLFYSTGRHPEFPIKEQAIKGDDWDFKLQPVYFVAILDFIYDEETDKQKFFREVALKDQDGELFYDNRSAEPLHFKFLQMPLFIKKETELVSHFDKWCYFLKNLGNFDQIPAILNEPIFQKAFHTTELAAMTYEQRSIYERSLLYYLDMKNVVKTAVDEAVEIAVLETIDKRNIEIAKKLLNRNLPISEISEDTGLILAQLQELRKAMK